MKELIRFEESVIFTINVVIIVLSSLLSDINECIFDYVELHQIALIQTHNITSSMRHGCRIMSSNSTSKKYITGGSGRGMVSLILAHTQTTGFYMFDEA